MIPEAIDTTPLAGRMMMQMLGAFAEFERAMIRERNCAGLAAARAAGRTGGWRRKLDAAKRREIAKSVITDRKSEAPKWPGSTTSARRPCHASWPPTAPAWPSAQTHSERSYIMRSVR